MADDMRVIVDTRRLDEAERQLLGGMLRQIVEAAAFKVEARAKDLVPVDTGATKNSIATTIEGDAAETTAQIGPTTEYAIYLEFGTYRMAPRPFLRPALAEVKPQFVEAVQQTLEKLVS